MYKIIVLAFISLIVASLAFSSEESKSEITSPKFNYVEVPVEDNSISERIDSFFQHRAKMGTFSGTVLYSSHDTIYYKNAFGLANLRKNDSLKADSRFQLASVSKTFTAFAIMLLEKEGKLSFNDDVKKYFPKFPYNNITIHELLVHRSGLPNYMYVADKIYRKNKKSVIDNYEMIDMFAKHKPAKYRNPDTKYNYNNTNYALLASIVEKVSKMKFQDFMKKNLFEPIGMNNTTIYDKNDSFENKEKVVGYINRSQPAENSYLNGVVGDKGVYSTVEDMNKFSKAIFDNCFFSDKEMEVAYQLYNKELHADDNYGYGWRINMLPDSSKIVYHAGWWKGFRTYFIRSLKDEKTIVVLSNNSATGKFKSKELMDLFNIKYEFSENDSLFKEDSTFCEN